MVMIALFYSRRRATGNRQKEKGKGQQGNRGACLLALRVIVLFED